MTPTGEPTTRSPEREAQRRGEVDRCRVEIAAIEALLLAGHPVVEGLCLELADWSSELMIIEGEKAEPPPDR
jgi:hypothetical protein